PHRGGVAHRAQAFAALEHAPLGHRLPELGVLVRHGLALLGRGALHLALVPGNQQQVSHRSSSGLVSLLRRSGTARIDTGTEILAIVPPYAAPMGDTGLLELEVGAIAAGGGCV